MVPYHIYLEILGSFLEKEFPAWEISLLLDEKGLLYINLVISFVYWVQ